jgi:ribonuclease BN (tRNA processing enzyme)
MDFDWTLRFLGTGSSHSEDLGSSSATLENSGDPVLLIDCGQGIPARYHRTYKVWPEAIFITHVHLDHISGLEQLQSTIALGKARPVRIYAPGSILQLLHERIGNLTCSMAEGRSNFWDQYQLIPVSSGFWHAGHWFDVFPVRHHAPGFAYGIRLAGRFLFTGDTRPIPEILRHFGNSGERLFHDCALRGNPSHTGWDDIEREYEPALRKRMVLYHYESAETGARLRRKGVCVAEPGKRYSLNGTGGKAPRVFHMPSTIERRVNGKSRPSPRLETDYSRRGFE